MKIHWTTGTYDYLKKLADRHREEKTVLMESAENALLLHETEGKSFFQYPRSYEVVASFNPFPDEGVVVMHHIYVQEESKPVLEYESQRLTAEMEGAQGLKAVRFLKPVKNEPYLFLSCWDRESSCERWEQSKTFSAWREKVKGMEKTGHFFPKSDYKAVYYIVKEEERVRE
ncbi:antibiotic biosynthesis monooxygenase [Caldibacillus debilis]|jgi:heme-degrading monooxygenase HmoA|uniref:ABM domain-containing protein n=1 Tax=Caldibacillus debilis GB1 TaxID=1339248 RepID=A0A420VDG4_9BACI|nr:antibiotic biosynthesis monooxygenase [Caldibacillus debilis]RKO61586.1 hypothetical protein Cdeb_01538 [Caldibacillus debilis GB1]